MGLGGGHGPAGGTWPRARGSGTGPASTGPPQTTQEQVESGCMEEPRGQGWGQVRDGIGAGPEGRHSPIPQLSSSSCCGPPNPVSTLPVPRFPHPWGPLLAAGRAEGAAWCRAAGLRLSRPRLSHRRGCWPAPPPHCGQILCREVSGSPGIPEPGSPHPSGGQQHPGLTQTSPPSSSSPPLRTACPPQLRTELQPPPQQPPLAAPRRARGAPRAPTPVTGASTPRPARLSHGGERPPRGSGAVRATSAGVVVPAPCPPPVTQPGASRARGHPAAGEPALEIGYLLLSLDPHVLHPLLYVLAFVGAALLALLQPGRRVHHLHGRDGNAPALSGQRISGGKD